MAGISVALQVASSSSPFPQRLRLLLLLPLLALSALPPSLSFSFTLDRMECFYEHVPKHQSTMVGFVVTKYDHYWPKDDAPHLVDVKVTDPSGNEVVTSTKKSEDELYFWSQEEGNYKVCVYNLARQHAQVSMDILEYYQFTGKKGGNEVVKQEEMDDVNREMQRLQGDLASTHHDMWYSFWLAQQHIGLDKELSRRLVFKTVLQGVLLVGCGAAQVFLLRRLFEKRMRTSRV